MFLPSLSHQTFPPPLLNKLSRLHKAYRLITILLFLLPRNQQQRLLINPMHASEIVQFLLKLLAHLVILDFNDPNEPIAASADNDIIVAIVKYLGYNNVLMDDNLLREVLRADIPNLNAFVIRAGQQSFIGFHLE